MSYKSIADVFAYVHQLTEREQGLAREEEFDRPSTIRRVEAVELFAAAIEETEQATAHLKARLNALVLVFSSTPEDILLEVAAYLYWNIPAVPTAVLAEAVVGERNIHELLRRLPPTPSKLSCATCQQPLTFPSRSQLQEAQRLRPHVPLECPACREARRREEYAEEQREARAYEARLKALRWMPYGTYLKTKEWQATRQHKLRQAGYRCQVCNAQNRRLEVHHRTYENRGQELDRDLIVLCHRCHETFHQAGQVDPDDSTMV